MSAATPAQPNCPKCKGPTKRVMCNQGPNQGHEFYGCMKKRDECQGFGGWCDGYTSVKTNNFKSDAAKANDTAFASLNSRIGRIEQQLFGSVQN